MEHVTDSLSYAKGGAGYQGHSRTSRAAAHGRPNSGGQREHVFKFIEDSGKLGATTDEIRTALLANGLIHQNSVMSARVRELEMAGRIVKTTKIRDTSAGHGANVYVTKEIFAGGGFLRDLAKPAQAKTAPAAKVKWANFAAYHEDFGPVLWTRFPTEEPYWCGTPGDSDWPYMPLEEQNLRWCLPPAPPEA